jgi:hypothetical protein
MLGWFSVQTSTDVKLALRLNLPELEEVVGIVEYQHQTLTKPTPKIQRHKVPILCLK